MEFKVSWIITCCSYLPRCLHRPHLNGPFLNYYTVLPLPPKQYWYVVDGLNRIKKHCLGGDGEVNTTTIWRQKCEVYQSFLTRVVRNWSLLWLPDWTKFNEPVRTCILHIVLENFRGLELERMFFLVLNVWIKWTSSTSCTNTLVASCYKIF